MARILPFLLLAGCVSPVDTASVGPETGTRHGETGPDTSGDSAHDSGAPDSGDSGDTAAPDPFDRPLNVVLILSDDQRADTMWAMPTVTERLLPESVRFSRAYTTVPMCCPMRASLLSGGWYPRDTGILSNRAPLGGATRFVDTDTLGTRLQRAGVATALVGKYLNEYERWLAPYVPPGWDRWVATGQGDGGYNHEVVIGSSTPDEGGVGTVARTDGLHLTQFLFEEALDFVDAHAGERFFLYLSPLSPHESGAPALEDLSLYPDWAPRAPAWDEVDVSDKPGLVRDSPALSEVDAARVDATARRMVRNLASLDRAVGTLLDGLADRGLLEDTIVIYVSDHGVLWGEHRLTGKGLPYEEALRVPLYARVPGLEGRDDARLVQTNTDLAATILDLLGAEPTGEGISLREALVDPAAETRDHVFVDNASDGTPVWAAVVTERWKYVEWGAGDVEIYDLAADPYELDNVADAAPPGLDRGTLGAWVDEHRALAITTSALPSTQVGAAYDEQLDQWGGTPPFSWSVGDGTLPPGLELRPDGSLHGLPTEEGTWAFEAWVEDTSVSPVTGRAQSFRASLSITVGEATDRVEAARIDTGSARFTFLTRPGVAISVRAGPDHALEGLVRLSPTVVADADGRAVVDLVGIDGEHAWHWAASFDGVVNARGILDDPLGR